MSFIIATTAAAAAIPCASHGLGLTTWSPLASGILTGKYSGGDIPQGSRFALEQYKVTAADGSAPGTVFFSAWPTML